MSGPRFKKTASYLADPGTPGTLRVWCRVCVGVGTDTRRARGFTDREARNLATPQRLEHRQRRKEVLSGLFLRLERDELATSARRSRRSRSLRLRLLLRLRGCLLQPQRLLLLLLLLHELPLSHRLRR